ncbi:MAG: hypothetical protein LBM26_00470 [Methanobrevibacter sp.]|jgi:hypothetical protein|nr:hypothetical protein [Methanobrevibacter sp.]
MIIEGEFRKTKTNSGFEFSESVNGSSFFSVPFDDGKVDTILSLYYPLDETEAQLSYEVLGYLFPFYLNKFKSEFSKIFRECNISPDEIDIFVYADTYIDKNPLIDDYLSKKVDSKKPIYFTSSKDENFYELTIVYSIEYIKKLFNPNNNSAEQFIIKEFIKDIYSTLRNDLNKEEIEFKAEKFISENIPDDVPGFTLELLYPISPIITKPVKHRKLSEKHDKEVEKEIEDYLRNESHIKPKTYTNKESLNIFNELFTFIQRKLENEVVKFNINLINCSYTEIEFLKYYRKLNEIHLGRATKTYTEYDVPEEKAKLLKETVHHYNILQHILETTLKVNSFESGKNIDEYSFDYIMALSKYAWEISNFSDSIYYETQNYRITINKDYSFDIIEEDVFDYEDYAIKHGLKTLNYDYTKYERLKEIEKEDVGEIDTAFDKEHEELNKAFEEELGFSYFDLIKLTMAMGEFIIPKDTSAWPLIKIEEKNLIKEIKNEILDDISQKTIINILNFLSLDYEKFKNRNPFIPNLLKMNENRFTIKPIIKLVENDKNYYIYGMFSVYDAGGVYSNKISNGRFPYKLNEGKVSKAIKNLEKLHNKRLEKELAKISSDIFGSENIIQNLKKFHNIDKSLPNRPPCGEIDCLTVDKNKKIIYVLEAKDISKAITPKELRNEFNKYFNPKDKKNYSNKLMSKVNFVLKNLKSFLTHFNIPEEEGWEVKYAFITYEVHISASHNTNNIEFIPLSQLKIYLQRNI